MTHNLATVPYRLATASDEVLRDMQKNLESISTRTSEQESFLAKVRNEIENRVEHEAKFEFGESNAKDIIEFLTTNIVRKNTKPRLRIQWNVALDVLIDRYPKLASRADDYTKKNPLLDWHRTFYRLVTDHMANTAVK